VKDFLFLPIFSDSSEWFQLCALEYSNRKKKDQNFTSREKPAGHGEIGKRKPFPAEAKENRAGCIIIQEAFI
jgi:hypothetical protein